jgi:hypothetical protein
MFGSKKNIGGGIGPLFSAFRPILLCRWLEQKAVQKACAAMSFLLFCSKGYLSNLLEIKLLPRFFVF